MSSPLRRSIRARRPNLKYSLTAFDDISNSDVASVGVPSQDSNDDEEFEIDKNVSDQEADEEEEDLIPSPSEDSDGQGSPEEAEADEDDLIICSEPGTEAKKPAITGSHKTLRHSLQQRTRLHANEAHTRGLADLPRHAAKRIITIYSFGSDPNDILPAMRSRDRWVHEPTLPSRDESESKKETGGLGYSYYYTPDMRRRESMKGWQWYYEQEGSQSISERQHLRRISAEDASRHLLKPFLSSLDVVSGPSTNQKLFSLGPGEQFDLTEAFDQAKVRSQNGISPKNRAGWIMNIGARIQCLDWMPHHAGPDQCLALSILHPTTPSDDGNNMQHLFRNPKAPAFTPSDPSPSAIQLLMVPSSTVSGSSGITVALDKVATISIVLCTDWGPVKQFKWCPVPPRVPSDDEPNIKSCRLLAGLWADGKIRVLDLSSVNMTHNSSTQYLHVDSVAFEFEVSNTVCSCITWLSSVDLAAGCANGCVAIWNLSKALRHPPGSKTPPWLNMSLHSSYILHLVSGYPSRPFLLATTGMDGYMRLTDLRAPTTDFVSPPRSRLGYSALTWLDNIQSFVSADDTLMIRAHTVRRFITTVAFARPTATVLALATSLAHPFVLIGGADGTVLSTNPLRRFHFLKVPILQQLWFVHEWRRGRPLHENVTVPETDEQNVRNGAEEAPEELVESGNVTALNNDMQNVRDGAEKDSEGHIQSAASHPSAETGVVSDNISSARVSSSVADKPLSRFTEGYKPVHPSLISGERSNDAGVVLSTVYEAQTAVTALAWNPNLCCGGWAAAGLGSGLLRVEDVAL